MPGFKYQPDIRAALDGWRDKLGTRYEEVVAKLFDRDRALEDFVTQARAAADDAQSDATGALAVAAAAQNDADAALASLALINLSTWQTWTPVITQGVTPTQTVNWGRYIRAGELIIAHFSVSFGATPGTLNNTILLSNFDAAANAASIGGSFRFFEAGVTNRTGTIVGSTTTAAQFFRDGNGNPFGVGDTQISSGDSIIGTLIYETA